jgi:hypothetical protein
LHEESRRDNATATVDATESSNLEELEELYLRASSPVWRTKDSVSMVSIIFVVVVIMTMCGTHGVSNSFANELLKYLSSTLLSQRNSLPNSFYHAKNTVRKMGLDYSVIHCYPEEHVLFRGDKQNLDSCPHPGCGLSRWIPGSTTVPAKVLRHFPLITGLKRMYRSQLSRNCSNGLRRTRQALKK